MRELTAGRLRELLHYDPETGVFTWRVRPVHSHRVGDIAGSDSGRRYRVIGVAGRIYKAHRLAWLYMTGSWPADQIDHINRDPSDNRFCNLREASPAQNQANSNRATGRLKGTRRNHRKWSATIGVNGKQRYLGSFDTHDEAALVSATASYAIHGAFARPHWRDVLADMRGVVEP